MLHNNNSSSEEWGKWQELVKQSIYKEDIKDFFFQFVQAKTTVVVYFTISNAIK